MRNLIFRNADLQPRVGAWDLLDEVFEDFTRDVSKIRRTYPETASPRQMSRFSPQMDISERDNAYLISVDLPGVKQADVNLRVDDDTLVISGSRARETRGEGQYFERQYGEFSRAVTLPKEIKQEAIEASFEDGVLQVVLPKQKAKESTMIKIKSGHSGFLDRWFGASESEKLESSSEKEVAKESKSKKSESGDRH